MSASTKTEQRAAPAADDLEWGQAPGDRMAKVVLAITGIRCVLMYMVLPAAGIIGASLDGAFLPGAGFVAEDYSVTVLSVSLVLHAVTLVTTTLAVRRAFRSRHRWRWHYAALGSTFFIFSAISILWEGALLLG